MPKETPLVCGKHPMLSLMGTEIMEAWKEPKFICVERSPEECYESMKKVPWCWHPSAAKYAFHRLADAREDFFGKILEKYQPPLLRIHYDSLKSEPEKILSELCEFLQYVPSPQQRKLALALIRATNDDCCYEQEIIKQPVQVVQGVIRHKAPVAKPHPSREKQKMKRKKR
jgi:hypothetical protein